MNPSAISRRFSSSCRVRATFETLFKIEDQMCWSTQESEVSDVENLVEPILLGKCRSYSDACHSTAFNVKTFLSLIQADGYNPLSVEAIVFVIRDLEACRRIATRAVGEAEGHRAQREALTKILHGGPFRPGQLFELMNDQNIKELMISRQELIDSVRVEPSTVGTNTSVS